MKEKAWASPTLFLSQLDGRAHPVYPVPYRQTLKSGAYLRQTEGGTGAMDCRTYPLGTLESYTYVVIFSLYEGKLLFSRHKRRGTFETQCGHFERGETPLEAAERELFEESGAVGYELRPAFDYWAGDAAAGAGGRVFVARIHKIGSLPESEIAETALFTRLPENLTYPDITPVLYRKAARDGWL